MEDYIQENIKIKTDYERYELACKFLYIKEENYANKNIGYITTQYGKCIEEFINDKNMTLHDLEIKYNKLLRFRNRLKLIKELVNQMSQHSDFLCLPGDVIMYFRTYFNYYLSIEEYTWPFLLKDIKTKHEDIIKSVDHKYRNKMFAKLYPNLLKMV